MRDKDTQLLQEQYQKLIKEDLKSIDQGMKDIEQGNVSDLDLIFEAKQNLSETLKNVEQINHLTESQSSYRNIFQQALTDFAKAVSDLDWALAGGLAVGFYSEPRGTMDIDIIILSEENIDQITPLLSDKFKKNRSHAFTHKETGLEVEILTADFLNIPQTIVDQALITKKYDSFFPIGIQIPIVSREGLIALKLQRGSRQDLADIEKLISTAPNLPLVLSKFALSQDQMQTFEDIQNEILN